MNKQNKEKQNKEHWDLGYRLASIGKSKPSTSNMWILVGWHDYQIDNGTGVHS